MSANPYEAEYRRERIHEWIVAVRLVMVAFALLVLFWAWGHWVGMNDARALMQIRGEQDRQKCPDGVAYVSALSGEVICMTGSNRAAQKKH